MVHAAADGKHIWLSELQGGRAGVGFDLSAEVTCEQQQRWLWNGIACGADTILFWCWRDEVFGREAGNFGLFGNDELSPARIAAMRESGDVLEKHRTLFDNYTPDEAQVAILFSPDNYYLAWAQDGSAKKMQKAIDGYARALVKHSIPSTFIESRNLADIDRFKLIIVPRVVSLTDEAEEQLVKFVRNGGTILVESECGAFNSDGFYRYPEKRFLNKLGIREAGRRPLLSPVEFTIDGRKISLECDQWLTPFADSENAPVEVYAKYKDLALGARYSCGKGNVIALLEGIDDVNAAMLLKEKVVSMSRDDVELPEGSFYIADIIGLRVVDEAGKELGVLDDILSPSLQQVYVIKGQREIMIPAVPEFILETNVEGGYIKVRLIEGM